VSLAETIALRNDLNASLFTAVVECESQFNPKAVGDHGKSHGLVQIHQPSHPDVSLAQAEDPEFALNFMATEWKRGNAWMWTCWKQLH
jgi:hypothetical protein